MKRGEPSSSASWSSSSSSREAESSSSDSLSSFFPFLTYKRLHKDLSLTIKENIMRNYEKDDKVLKQKGEGGGRTFFVSFSRSRAASATDLLFDDFAVASKTTKVINIADMLQYDQFEVSRVRKKGG